MSKFLSKVFESSDPDWHGPQGGESGSSGEQTVEGGAGVDVDLTVSVHNEVGYSYETADGGSGGWSQTNDATLTLSSDAALHQVSTLGYDEMSEA